jgi:hypothetical protein
VHLANIHALYLGEVGEERHAVASHRGTIQARHEEPDIGREDRLQRQAMPLLRRILRREYSIELADQSAHIVAYGRHQFDSDFIGAAHQLLRHG